MLDADAGRSRIVVRGNSVHDAECGDGIDVRAMGSARIRAKIKANAVSRLRESSEFQSVLAIGLQSADTVAARSRRVDRNTQADLGNEGADSEGVFINPTGPSRIDAKVTRNEYSNDDHLGGFSANGLEFVSMGDGSTGIVEVADSSFTGTPGDVLEQLALGTNAYLSLELDNVLAADSSGFGGERVRQHGRDPGQQRRLPRRRERRRRQRGADADRRQHARELRQQRAHVRLLGRQRQRRDVAARPRRSPTAGSPRTRAPTCGSETSAASTACA